MMVGGLTGIVEINWEGVMITVALSAISNESSFGLSVVMQDVLIVRETGHFPELIFSSRTVTSTLFKTLNLLLG